MAEHDNPREVGERVARLVGELRTLSSPRVWERVDELLRSLLDLYGRMLERVVEIASAEGSATDLRAALLADPLVATLLAVHGVHPVEAHRRVEEALDRVRRAFGADASVELLGLDEAGVVRVRLEGGRHARRAALLALKAAIEGAIEEAVPEVSRVEVEGVSEGGEAHGLVQLGRPPREQPEGKEVAEPSGARVASPEATP